VERGELSINKIGDFPVNWSFVRNSWMSETSTVVICYWNGARLRYGFCRRSSITLNPIRNPSNFRLSITESLACEATTKSIIDSPLANTQHTTDRYLRLQCTPWWIVWPDIGTGTITFRAIRASHSEVPTSSRLSTKWAQQSCTSCLRYSTILSKNHRGISSHGFSRSD
jgi:hypothetical protein